MKSIFSALIAVSISSAAHAAMCEDQAKAAIVALENSQSPPPPGFGPVVKYAWDNVASPESGTSDFKIDLENSHGEVLKATEGGSTYAISIDFWAFIGEPVGCSVKSIRFLRSL